MVFGSQKYYFIGVSVILVVGIMFVFSDGRLAEYDYTGIVHSVSESENGFTFYLDTSNGTIRCFFRNSPVELGWYAVAGSLSDDGSMFFVSYMQCLD